jgi:thioesterase domain-containing protein/acyl carrier protein
VREAVAIAVGDRTSRRLVTAVTTALRPAIDDLRRYLEDRLPAYMVPARIDVLDELPLSANGKVDRGRLAADLTGARHRAYLAPRDELERRLVALWEDVLETRPIGVVDPFFEIGGDSLLAAHLVVKLEEAFGRRLPLGALLAARTVEGLASLLRQTVPDEERLRVPIRREGDGAPLFLVHPIGGHVLCYAELAAALPPGRPVWGIQAPGAHELDVAQLAARYLEEVRAVQPVGPHILGGWSFGGLVALEMARQLEPSAVVILIDTVWPPAPRPDDTGALVRFASDLSARSAIRLDWDASLIAATPAPERLGLVLDRLRAAGLRGMESREQLARAFDVFRANLRAMHDHAPAPTRARVVSLRARATRSADWDRFESVELPGDHYSLLVEPHVRLLASHIDAALKGM